MHHLTASTLPQAKLQKDVPVSYDKSGSGPPLILVHGSFSDHKSNWAFVKPLFEQQFTVYAIARRGRGETVATIGHSLDDESQDVVALIQAIDEPVFLLGHSYGAQVALAATAKVPDRVSKLVLYEAPYPQTIGQDALTQLNRLAQAEQWEEFAVAFFRDTLLVPVEVLDELKATEDWRAIVADAKASLGDMQALIRSDFKVDLFCNLQVPVLLQIGTASPRDLYITDALAAVLPNACIEALPDQAHEGMTTAPEMYAEVVSRFLLGTHGIIIPSTKP
jgi:pimeloyl-ACP methyl ester carboxylesterase